jgi:hypothetical protein
MGTNTEKRCTRSNFGPSNCDANYRDFIADGVDIATAKFYADLGW